MTTLVMMARQGSVLVKFLHIKTGEELQRNVTLYPYLIPHGFTVNNIDNSSTKVPLWDMDNQVWMDLEKSTIISYKRT
tara:strand:- start:38 stop:271 length:234 start_codon:yes stop_codon:yes gene_type:complete